MKINGQEISGPSEIAIPIPRPAVCRKVMKDGQEVVETVDKTIVFKAGAVLDYSDFHNLCPAPVPPRVMKPGNKNFLNTEDSEYRKKLTEYASKKVFWVILKSLEATPGLEWDTVKKEDSDTWKNYSEDLKKAGFSEPEVNYIVNEIFKVNAMSDQYLEEARQSFLASQAV